MYWPDDTDTLRAEKYYGNAMLDKTLIGKSFPPLVVDVDRWQLKFFAKAVGEENPIYFDEAAAVAQGYRAILAPPTYGVTLGCAVPDPFARAKAVGLDATKILHTAQSFEYFEPICGGDKITLVATITDVFEKRRGAFKFMVEETVATNQLGQLTTRFRQTVVERS
ncbi:MAG: MaoC family dehydratase N-terminal domain-containing protein [Gammaproteobacteria bacterium]|nr:MaoC family dehydratase N-terminal domain-containing protein [Gammaproteobacteria bacterium]